MPALEAQQQLSDVLTELQRIGSHLGQVRENNRTLGVIALEDVVEAFVGEVEDASHLDAEHDPRPGHEHTGEDVRPAGAAASDVTEANATDADVTTAGATEADATDADVTKAGATEADAMGTGATGTGTAEPRHRRDDGPSPSDERMHTPAGPATAQEADG